MLLHERRLGGSPLVGIGRGVELLAVRFKLLELPLFESLDSRSELPLFESLDSRSEYRDSRTHFAAAAAQRAAHQRLQGRNLPL